MLLCGVLYLGCIARYKVKSSGSELLVGWLQLWMASALDGFSFGWLQVWMASGLVGFRFGWLQVSKMRGQIQKKGKELMCPSHSSR